MTCREKLAMEYPEEVSSGCFGGCSGCPMDHGYQEKPEWCDLDKNTCTRCWDREVKFDHKDILELGKAIHMGFERGLEYSFYASNINHRIRKVIFNDPATIILWNDGTKTVVKAENELFDPEKGMAMAVSKKFFGNGYSYYNQFKRWLPKKK